ncbi:hypothetical protein [Mariprofundus ferrooxydans]
MRDEYRNFRFDRIRNIELLYEHHPPHPGCNLEYYLTE